ncbi:MAG: hypothetical protein IKP20_01180 [Candidatus Methanomethylophilaceae archaeon]|nr:hypothetical protein [Candidatus Methanomethylophilaceae archaeon]
MKNEARAASAFAIALLLAVTCLPISFEEAGADVSDRTYGTAMGFSWTEVEKISEQMTGKSVEELIMDFSESQLGFELRLSEPHFEGEFATKRDVRTVGTSYLIDDHVSAYIEFVTAAGAHGNMPEEGTYQRQEGEDEESFLERILKGSASPDPRDIDLSLQFCIYVDVDISTEIDTVTGEMVRSDVFAKLFVVEYESRDFDVSTAEDSDGVLDEVTIQYRNSVSYSNFYVSMGMGLTYEGMKIFDSRESWSISPKMTQHIDEITVSSDLASGLWNMVSQFAGIEGLLKSRLPDLVLNIIESGSRVVDLVETLKSLTGTTIKDIDYLAEFQASNVSDEAGDEYVELRQVKGDAGETFRLPKSAYCIEVSDILRLVPSYILDERAKDIIELIAILLGWGTVDVDEMDDETKGRYEAVYEHTNAMIKYDEEYELKIPIEYVAMSTAGLIGCLGAAILMRRRSA